MGDGHPIECEISFHSPLFGAKFAFGMILTEKLR